jgi:hypothetical protein
MTALADILGLWASGKDHLMISKNGSIYVVKEDLPAGKTGPEYAGKYSDGELKINAPFCNSLLYTSSPEKLYVCGRTFTKAKILSESENNERASDSSLRNLMTILIAYEGTSANEVTTAILAHQKKYPEFISVTQSGLGSIKISSLLPGIKDTLYLKIDSRGYTKCRAEKARKDYCKGFPPL